MAQFFRWLGPQLYTSTYDISALSVRYNFTYGSGNLPEPTMTGGASAGGIHHRALQ
jgi:hypothetical protein